GADAATVAELLDGEGAVIGACNSPGRTVISGAAAAVDTALERARVRGLATTRLRVSHAFHSPLMAAAGPRLAAELEATVFAPLARPVASTVTGALLAPEDDLRGLLRAQLTSLVRFAGAFAAVQDRADLWIEAGPGRALSELAGEMAGTPVIPLDVGGKSCTGLLAAAGAAFALGAPLDAAYLLAGRFSRPFAPARPLRFLENPCERAPVPAPEKDAGAARRGRPALPVRPAIQGGHAGPPLQETSSPPGVRALLRQLVAEKAELPQEAVTDDS